MSAVNLKQVKRYCGWVGPNDEELDWRLIYPKERPNAARHHPRNFRGSPTDKRFLERLLSLNDEDYYGVFLTVNRTDGHGVRASNVTGIRAVWMDADKGLPDGGF